jgi:serine/threonine-protein kinase
MMRWIGRLDGSSGEHVWRSEDPRPVRPDIDEALHPNGARAAHAERRLGRVVGGRYRLERLLRTGHIASAYLAVDGNGERGMVETLVLEEPVAAMAPAAHFSAVFHRVVGLSHANILPTLDAGVDGALRYVVTALRPQDTLKARLERERPLPMDEALSLAQDVAAGLAHAHARGVMHGDVRPKQIAVGGGRACLCAFGFAESVVPGAGIGEGSAVLTIGSTAYHSPEQLMGEVRLDARCDVYAVGCVLFEMLAGRPPFGGQAGPSNLLKLTQPPPNLLELRDTVPVAVAALVQRCLARVPADRYASGEALLRALAEAREPRGVGR